MLFYDLIKKKRDGMELQTEEIHHFVKAVTTGEIPDYQIAAFLMAAFLMGLSTGETAELTLAMACSGDTIDLSHLGKSVDKHSTGGVADTTTLITGPLVAACGVPVAKMTGRGLGHTGGTVDKLESIPGFTTALSLQQFLRQIDEIGIALISATAQLAPADKILYALRDVTATVDSVPLIASSIMSKKIAAGATHIVLDVKYGRGAFMKKVEDAEVLARTMVEIGRLTGRPTVALLTSMEEPLGSAIGNSLEVMEARRILSGQGGSPALRSVSLALARELLMLYDEKLSSDDAVYKLDSALTTGRAYDKLRELISAQGGDLEKPLPLAAHRIEITAPEEGYIAEVDALALGQVAVLLGAGRARKDDPIDYGAGLELAVRRGDRVKKGQSLASAYSSQRLPEDIIIRIQKAFLLGDTKPPNRELIVKTVR
jgi:pyrimidine-nucleoside phosphorylase